MDNREAIKYLEAIRLKEISLNGIDEHIGKMGGREKTIEALELAISALDGDLK